MKLTFNEWAHYPTTEEAQHEKRLVTLTAQCLKICKKSYTEKLKRILVLMGFTKLHDMKDKPKELKQFEMFFKPPFLKIRPYQYRNWKRLFTPNIHQHQNAKHWAGLLNMITAQHKKAALLRGGLSF